MKGRASNGKDRGGISGVEPEGARNVQGRVVWRFKETVCGLRRAFRQVARPCFLLMLMALTATAATVTLAWDQSTDPTVVGYRLYYGGASRIYTNVIERAEITTTTCTVSNLIAGRTYYFAATCFNEIGLESDYSIEVSYAVPSNTVPTTPVITVKFKSK